MHTEKGLSGKRLPSAKRGSGVKVIQSVSCPWTSDFSRGGAMIQSHIGSTWSCGVILKLERFSHLSDQSFGLGFPIELGYLSQ